MFFFLENVTNAKENLLVSLVRFGAFSVKYMVSESSSIEGAFYRILRVFIKACQSARSESIQIELYRRRLTWVMAPGPQAH